MGDLELTRRHAAALRNPAAVHTAEDASLYVADANNFRVRRLVPVLPGYSREALRIPSKSGDLIYEFDANGRHVRTRHGLTGRSRPAGP